MLVNGLRADRINRSCAGRVHQGSRVADFHLSFHRLQSERHGQMLRHHGPNLNQLGSGRKSSERYTDPIDAKCKVLRNVLAIVSNLEIQMELIPFAHEFARRRESCPLQIVYLDLKFSPPPLGENGTHDEEG